MKGRRTIEPKRIKPYVVKAAARRLGFSPTGAQAMAINAHAPDTAEVWLDCAHHYLELARDALIVAQAQVPLDRVRHAMKAVHHTKRNMISRTRLAKGINPL